jgi:hypothetical protein
VNALEQVNDPHARHFIFGLFRNSITILSNLSQAIKIDARQEILKFKVMDLMAQILSSTSIELDLVTLDDIMWFLRHLTVRFETRHISMESEQPLIYSMIKILHIPEQDQRSHAIILNTVKTLVNLTKCESVVFGREDPRSDFALDQIINYEKQDCSQYQTPSFWIWVQNRVVYLTEDCLLDSKEAALEVFSEMETLLRLILNMVASEDSEKVKYFLGLALKAVLEKVLVWNMPPGPDSPKVFYSLEVDMMILKIFKNLVESDEAFGNGLQIA